MPTKTMEQLIAEPPFPISEDCAASIEQCYAYLDSPERNAYSSQRIENKVGNLLVSTRRGMAILNSQSFPTK